MFVSAIKKNWNKYQKNERIKFIKTVFMLQSRVKPHMTHSCFILRRPLPNQRLMREAWRQRRPTDAGRVAVRDAGRQLRWNPRDDTTTHSPDKQQDEAVQTPLQGAEAHALDAHQLVGLILAQSGRAAARHDQLRANSEGGRRRNLWLIPSLFSFLCGRSHVLTSAAAVDISPPQAHVMRFPCSLSSPGGLSWTKIHPDALKC